MQEVPNKSIIGNESALVRTKDAAKLTGFNKKRINDWCSSGELDCQMVGNSWRIVGDPKGLLVPLPKTYKRVCKQWSEEENFAITIQAGEEPTKVLAGRFGVSRKAIQSRYQTLGISPFTNDAFITAAEAARRMNLPEATVIDRLNKKQMDGYRVGRYWRIDPETLDQFEKPKWNGRQVLGFVEKPPQEGPHSCIQCGVTIGKPHGGRPNVWCSGRCKGEFREEFCAQMKVGECGIKDHLPPHLRRKFLDWTTGPKVGLLERSPTPVKRYGFLKREELSDDEDFLRRVVLDANSSGYLMPLTRDSGLKAMNIADAINGLNEKITNSSCLLLLASLDAIGIGVKRFDVSLAEAVFLRRLWQKEGSHAPLNYLSWGLEEEGTQSAMENLANQLNGKMNGYQIDCDVKKFANRSKSKGFILRSSA